jgi:hypothetical protein
MGECASAKRLKHLSDLPNDLMHVIFSKLEFLDKVTAGLVCKHWYHLLRAGTTAAKHWVVDYDVDNMVSHLDTLTRAAMRTAEQFTYDMGRYATRSYPPCRKGGCRARLPQTGM